MDLNQFFTDNYAEIERIASIHKSEFDKDVVISNLYLYLSGKECELNDDNVMSYVIQWCSKLKYWNKNRSQFLMEEKAGRDIVVDGENDVIADYSITTNIDFKTHFDNYVKGIDSYMDRCILRDYYEDRSITTIHDIMNFYNVKRTQAFEIKKKILELEKGLYLYIKNKIIC